MSDISRQKYLCNTGGTNGSRGFQIGGTGTREPRQNLPFRCGVLEWTDVTNSGHTRICNRFLVKTPSTRASAVAKRRHIAHNATQTHVSPTRFFSSATMRGSSSYAITCSGNRFHKDRYRKRKCVCMCEDSSLQKKNRHRSATSILAGRVKYTT